jgi:hypothetical protein
MDSHDLSGQRTLHIHRALIELLRARQLDRPQVENSDEVIREVLALVCGFGGPGESRRIRSVIDNSRIDELFPPQYLAESYSAGCGKLILANGEVILGKGVDW